MIFLLIACTIETIKDYPRYLVRLEINKESNDMKHTYKIARNKGNARVWIEGNRLSDNEWPNGTRFNKKVNDETLVLTVDDDGKHKVAGTVDRPIIDMCGKYVTEFFGDDATHYVADIKPGKIIIRAA